MKRIKIIIIFLLGISFSSYGQKTYESEYDIYIYQDTDHRAYTLYEQGWISMEYGRVYSVLNFVNSSLRSKVTIQALALKAKALWLLDSNSSVYQSLLAYREAEKLDVDGTYLPSYVCVTKGEECGKFYEWKKLEQIRASGYRTREFK